VVSAVFNPLENPFGTVRADLDAPVLTDGWLFLESFYILPKWLGRYVQASTETCDFLGSAGVLGRRQDSGSPVGPLF